MVRRIFLVLNIFYSVNLLAQCPSSSFSTDKSIYCINEPIVFTNESIDGDFYEWNFCPGQLSNSPKINNSFFLQKSLPLGITYVAENGNWYGFYTSRQDNSINRLEFGSDLNSIPTEISLGNPGNLLSSVDKIEIIKEGNNWYGFVLNETSTGKLIRLDFGNDITGSPSAEDLGSLGNRLNLPKGISVDSTSTDKVVTIVNRGNDRLISVNFGNSFSNAVEESNILQSNAITGANGLHDLEVVYDCPNWYGYSVSRNNGKVFRLNFGNSLHSIPVSSEISVSSGLVDPFQIDISHDGLFWRAFISDLSGTLERFDFIDGLEQAPQSQNTGLSLGRLAGLSIVSDSIIKVQNFDSRELYHLSFKEECFSSIEYSELVEPDKLRLTSAGAYPISLKVTSSNGDEDRYIDSITVTSSESPALTIEKGSNRCISNPISFTANVTSGTVSTYSWDLDGDAMEDSNTENAMIQYPAANTYPIHLDVVGDNGCTNFVLDTVKIYPEPPLTSFSISGLQCTNNEITLTNTTDESGYDDVLSYEWEIAGDAAFQKDTVYKFDTSGSKTIRLRSLLPGCISAFTEQEINVQTGPEVSFTYLNNCFGEDINFNGEIVGSGITDISWDFGDASGTSAIEDPIYQFGTAGTYNVNLAVTNDQGCITTFTEELEVNDQPLVDFTFGDAIENLPVSFSGQDLTLEKDSIISWSWRYESEQFGTGKDTVYIFSEPGTKTIELSIETAQGCMEVLSKQVEVVEAICPTSSFLTQKTSYCIDEPVKFTNNSVNGNNYNWNFCPGALEGQLSTASILNTGSLLIGAQYVQVEGKWYGFVTSRGTNELLRFDFGENLASLPTITSLGNPGGFLTNADKILLIEENSNWFGLVLDETASGNLIRLNFGSDIEAIPTAEQVANLDGLLNLPKAISYHEDKSDKMVIVGNRGDNSLVLLNFSNSIQNPLEPADIFKTPALPGVSSLHDLEIAKECSSWTGYTLSRGNGNIVRLNFGDSLFQSPSVETILSVSNVVDPFQLDLKHDGTIWRGFVSDLSGNIERMDFINGLAMDPEIVPLNLEIGRISGLQIIQDTLGFYSDIDTDEIFRIDFENDCSASIKSSSFWEPLGVSYQFPGTYRISLAVTSENGNTDYYLDSISVSSQESPDLQFNKDPNLCLTNPNTFTADVTSGTVDTYSWDLNGDGLEDANTSSTEFQYAATGTYPIRLDVTADNGCSNFVLDTVRIYDPPAAPQFDLVADLLCEAEPVQLVNQFDASGYDDVLSYTWYDGNQVISSARDTTVEVAGTGEKRYGLQVSIPGCTTAIEYDTIFVNPTPQVDFSANLVCEGETTNFTNFSDPGTTYEWQFGDGFASTTESTEHTYGAPGLYQASLRLVDENGCTDTAFQEVKVGAFPVTDFDYGLVCDNASAQFTSSVELTNADAASYEWFRNGALVTTLQDPSILIADSSQVSLRVVSSDGCADEVVKPVMPLQSPQANFSFEIGCFEDPVVFQNQTSDIIDRQWTIDGQDYFDDTLAVSFENPGIIPVSLSIQGSNLCTSEVDTSLFIPTPPEMRISAADACVFSLASFIDSTEVQTLGITGRQWQLNGQPLGTAREVIYRFAEAGENELALQVQTEDGCTYGTSELINVLPQPVADFDISSDYGVPGTTIDFSNNNPGAASLWKIFEDSVATETNLSYNFEEPGNYDISLVSQSEAGCTDTSSMRILIANPEMDLKITGLELVQSADGNGRVFVTVRNEGNLPVEDLGFTISLEDQFTVRETVLKRINQMTENTVQLTAEVPSVGASPAYLCISVENPYGVEDRLPFDNKECLTIDPSIVVERPYPNPVDDIVTIPVILPEAGKVKFTIYNQSGGRVREDTFERSSSGLSLFTMDLQNLLPGIYFVEITIGEFRDVSRMVVR